MTDVGYHYEQDVVRYLIDAGPIMYDRKYDILLINNTLCCNYDDFEAINAKFDLWESAADRDFISLMSHEQYSYPDYFNYIPNHLDRVEEACRQAYTRGYKPSWFPQGILGNTAWEE